MYFFFLLLLMIINVFVVNMCVCFVFLLLCFRFFGYKNRYDRNVCNFIDKVMRLISIIIM